MAGERKVKEEEAFKSSAGKRKRTSTAGKELGTERSDRMLASHKAAANEVRSVDGKVFKEETVVSTIRRKAKYTAVTSMGTQTEEGHVKEEVVEEKIWRKDEISYSWEAKKDLGRKMKHKAVGRDERSVDYDATIKREVMDGEGTNIRIKKEKASKKSKAEESEINELLNGGNVSGHKTGTRKQQKAGRASEGPERDGEKEETIESRVSIKTSGLEGAGNTCLERECKGRTPVHERGLKERGFSSKRCQLAEGDKETEGGDAESRRPRRSQQNLTEAAAGREDEQLLKRRRRWAERGQVGHRVAEEKAKMHESLLELVSLNRS